MDFSCVLLCTLATLPRSGAEMFGGSCGPLASPRTCGACVRVCVCVARIREFLCMYAHVCVCSVYNKKSAVAAPFARTQVLLIHKHTHCVIYVNEIRSPNKQACVCLRASALTRADNIYENPLTEQYKTHFRRVGGEQRLTHSHRLTTRQTMNGTTPVRAILAARAVLRF